MLILLLSRAHGATLDVDCSVDQGPVTRAANGYLVSVTPTQPSAAYIAPLRPTTFRANPRYLFKVYRRLYELGVRDFQVCIAFNWDYNGVGYLGTTIDDWNAYITQIVNLFESNGMRVDYDIMNEPDLGSRPIQEADDLYVLWKSAYQIIRNLAPNSKIIGPSIAYPPRLKPFLTRVQQEGVFPDIVSYHQYQDPTAAAPFAADIRNFMSTSGMGTHELSVNEILGDGAYINAGYIAGTLAAYDKIGIVSAHHACWTDPTDTTTNQELNCCDNPSLDGLLTTDLQGARSGWWVYKGYADMSGRLVKFSSSLDRIDGLAGFDAAAGGATILIGKYGEDLTGNTTLTIRNLNNAPYLINNGVVRVKAERIPNMVGAPLNAPIVELDINVGVNANAIQVVLPRFNAQDAYIVRLGSLAGPGFNQLPTVSLTSNGTNFTAPAGISLTANVSDSDGTVSRVDFYSNAVLVGSDATAPFTYTYSGVSTGNYSLNAKATDNKGGTGWSHFVFATVTPSATQEPIVTTYRASTDFSGVQGQRGWSYLDNLGRPLTWNNVYLRWETAKSINLCIWNDGGHPGIGPGGDSVRRWTAPTAGSIRITGNVMDTDAGGGDGVRIDIRKGVTSLWEGAVWNGNAGHPNGLDYDLYATVAAGDTIDFVIHKWVGISWDSTRFDPTITFYSAGSPGNQPPSVSLAASGGPFTAPANITLNATASDSDGTVAAVAFYNGGTLLGTDTTSPYSFIWSNVAAGSYTLTAKAADNAGAQGASNTVNVTVNPPQGAQTPYGGTPMAVPGTINVAHYDNGGEGVAFHDIDGTNQLSGTYRPGLGVDSNGAGVGWIVGSEWLEYTVDVSVAGTYTISIPVSQTAAGGTMHVSFNGVNVTGSLSIPNTGDWGTYQTITKSVSLNAGQQVMLAAFDANGANGFGPGLRDIGITGGASNQAPAVALTAPANNATFTAPANITLGANASDSDGAVSKVDFYHGSALLGSDTTSPYSFAWTNVAAGSYALNAKATDNGGTQTTSATVNITVNPPQGGNTPYNGTPMAIPGTILTAQYDNGGQGVAYHDLETFNFASSTYRPGEGVDSMGSGIGWIKAGEWLEYSVNVSSAGAYMLSIPVSHPGTGATMHVSFNGVNVTGTLAVPDTGSWSTFQTISKSVTLGAGPQVMLVAFDANGTTGYGPGLGDIGISSGSGNQAPAVTLTAPANNATFVAPASITLSANASDSDGTISKVEFFQGAALLGADTTSPYSFAWSNVASGSYALTVKATDNVGAMTTSATVNIIVNPSQSGQTPYSGAPMTVPGTILTAQYDNGGEGVAYHDVESANLASSTYRAGQGVDSPGTGVGWIVGGEWLEYTVNVSAAGAYTITIPVSQTAAGGTMHVSFNGVNVTGSLSIPNTGDWGTYQTITKSITLNAGQQVMLVAFDANAANGYGPGLLDIGIGNGGTAIVGNGSGLQGSYFNNSDFTGLVVTRTDATVNFAWGNGSPDPLIGQDTFSVRWEGQVQAQYSETYAFFTATDDGARLWVDGKQLVNDWKVHGTQENSGTIALVAGQKYDVTFEYFENAGGADAKLSWSSPSTAKQVIPKTQLYLPPVGGTALGFLIPGKMPRDLAK